VWAREYFPSKNGLSPRSHSSIVWISGIDIVYFHVGKICFRRTERIPLDRNTIATLSNPQARRCEDI
jgi:hypothetical protein